MNKLRDILAARRCSQSRLADLAGMQRTHVNRIVRGAEPTLRNARRIADALGVSIDELWPSSSVTTTALDPSIET